MYDVVIAYLNDTRRVHFARVVRPGEAHPNWFQIVTRRKPGEVLMDWAGNGADRQFHIVETAEWHNGDFVLTLSPTRLTAN